MIQASSRAQGYQDAFNAFIADTYRDVGLYPGRSARV